MEASGNCEYDLVLKNMFIMVVRVQLNILTGVQSVYFVFREAVYTLAAEFRREPHHVTSV